MNSSLEHGGIPKFASQTRTLIDGPPTSGIYAEQSVHPTKVVQDKMRSEDERKKLQMMSAMSGSHMAQRYLIEAQYFSQFKRPSGYRSNFHQLNCHMDKYNELDFNDIMGDPIEIPDLDEGRRLGQF